MATFVSPIDGKTYSTEYTGNKTIQQVLQDVSGTAGGESARLNIPVSGWTGALTNNPGDALTYANPVNTFSAADIGSTIEMADPEYQRWMSNYWAYLHPEEYAATQAEQMGGGGLFDMAKGLATSNTMMPIWAALGAGLGGLGGGAAAGADAASLAAGDAMAGAIPAGELSAWTGDGGLGTGGSNMGIFDSWFDPLGGAGDIVGQSSGWDFGPLSDSLMNGGIDPTSGLTLDQMKPGLLDTIKSYITSNPGSTVKSAISALTSDTGGGSLLGAGIGGLAGLLGGAKQAGTVDTTQTPWGPQQPFLLDAWSKAKAASEATNPIQSQANANFQSVLSGPTVNPMLGMDNPYLTKAIDNANADVTRAMMPAMNQANRATGSFGNSGVADIYSKNMTDAYSRNANDMRFKDYTNQQQLQQSAVGNTLGFTTGASAFNAAPAQDYAKTVQGNYGGTTSSPYFTNNASSMLGGATLGYNLFGGK